MAGVALGAASAISGCFHSAVSPEPSPRRQNAFHYVHHGETLYGIARHYGVSVGDLMAANGIKDPRDLHVGQRLMIPVAYAYASMFAGTEENGARRFAWPIDHGVVSSGFGPRNGTVHDGVDIAAPAGTPVHAAANGTVVFAGWLRGYGNAVIIRHDEHYVTVYGHDSVNRVREGQRVVRGQTIGAVGTTGRTTGANLHFEVRRDNVARDPLAYLPAAASTAGITFARYGGY